MLFFENLDTLKMESCNSGIYFNSIFKKELSENFDAQNDQMIYLDTIGFS